MRATADPVPAGSALPRLSAPELAFVRAWAEGVNLQLAWQHYLGNDDTGDVRSARPTLRRLLDRLRGWARAQGRPDLAALLGRDPEAMADPAASVPTLEDFRALQPADFYNEAELAELYEAEYGQVDARSTARRRQRLRERMVRALATVESWGTRPLPAPGDALARWLEPAVFARLQAAGLERLEDLLAHIRTQGYRWYREVPRLGPRGAARLVAWLQEHQATLGTLPAHALGPPARPARPPTAALAPWTTPAGPPGREGPRKAGSALVLLPLEVLASSVKPALERNGDPAPGSLSTDPGAGLLADCETVLRWLALRPQGSHTWRAYRREAERLLLWAHHERRIRLAALSPSDASAYLSFLAQPGDAWSGPRSTPRWSSAWRPFEGPLSPRSITTAHSILRAMYGWWVDQGLAPSNPWDGLAVGSDGGARSPATSTPRPLRALPEAQWAQLQAWLARQAPSPARARLALVLGLSHGLGLRAAELVSLRWAAVRSEATSGGAGTEPADPDLATAWRLRVTGRGERERVLPLTPPLVQLLTTNLRARQLADRLDQPPAQAPLISQLGREQPLSAMRLYELVKHALGHCARELERQDAAAAQALRRASTHWLRHSYGVREAARGVPARRLQEQMGHLSRVSTRGYLGPSER